MVLNKKLLTTSCILMQCLCVVFTSLDASNSSSSSSNKDCRGDRGPRGPRGNVGDPGPQGIRGPQGIPFGQVNTPDCEQGCVAVGIIDYTNPGPVEGNGYSYTISGGVVSITFFESFPYSIVATAVDPTGGAVIVNTAFVSGTTYTLTPSNQSIPAISFMAFACEDDSDVSDNVQRGQ